MKARANFVVVANDIGASDKAVELSEDNYLAAIGLYVLAVCYCDRQNTDGAIPANAMRRAIAPGIATDDALQELARVGFLEDHPDGWVVSGYLNWQRSKAEKQAAIEQRRAAGGKGGRAKASAPKTLGQEDNDITDTTDKRALDDSPSESPSESQAVDVVRSAASNKLTAEEAFELIEQFGKERCITVAHSIISAPPAGGIKSMRGLMRHQLERGAGEAAPVSIPPKAPCINPACVSGHVITDAGEAARCPECGGGGHA